jgi:hypothetical protein
MALGSTQPLTEMSTRNLPGSVKGGRRVGLTADCLDKMWDPRRLTTLWAFTACYRDSYFFFFAFLLFILLLLAVSLALPVPLLPFLPSRPSFCVLRSRIDPRVLCVHPCLRGFRF